MTTTLSAAEVFAKTLTGFILKAEGGFNNDRDDHGGATMHGVTQAVYDAYRKRVGQATAPVIGISDLEVRTIYKNEYWDAAKCSDIVAAGAPHVAAAVFNFAINESPRRAVRMLQQVVGVGKSSVDGITGPSTISHLRSAIKQSSEQTVVQSYLDAERAYYHSIGKGSQEKWLNGWLNRTDELAQFLTTF